ncbi:MAG TPA: ABC transporter permease [Sphingobacteriaceae bacterium]|nr:ABC transporter permease [Sphingobacteriaceae bacterium]
MGSLTEAKTNVPDVHDAGQADRAAGKPAGLWLRDRLARYVPFMALVLLLITFSILAPGRFATLQNGKIVLEQTAVLAIVSFGLTFVIVAGSIDLSVGSVVALAGMVAAGVTASHGPYLGMAAGLGVGLATGFTNGLIFTRLRIPSFITTLGMLTIARGLTLLYSKGAPMSITAPAFLRIGKYPGILYLTGIVFIVSYVVYNYTTFGRYTQAIGGDERVTELAGVAVRRIKMGIFTLCGALAALGGVTLAARMGAATPTTGTGFELDVIAAVVLGGTPLTGGMGNVSRSVLGALIASILSNGLVILGVESATQMVIKGIVLFLAVFISFERSKVGIIK